MSNDQNRPVPKIVALEVLEKNGVNVQRLIELIRKGVGAEFTTYYYYTILRMHCTGLDGEGIKEIFGKIAALVLESEGISTSKA